MKPVEMTIDDYQREIDYLFEQFSHYPNSANETDAKKSVLKTYLVSKQYSPAEIDILVGLATIKFNQYLDNRFSMLKPHFDGQYLGVIPQVKQYTDYLASYGKYTEDSDRLYDFIDMIANSYSQADIVSDIPSKFLFSSTERRKMERAEEWLKDNGYLDEILTWKKFGNDLAGLLFVLLDLKILSSKVKLKEIDEYFAKRYHRNGVLKDTLKRSKLKSSKFDQFKFLKDSLEKSPN